MSSPTILIMGADGSLGRRLCRIVGDLGIPFLPAKWSGQVKKDIEDQEIRFGGRDLYLIDGPDLEQRAAAATADGFNVIGKVGNVTDSNLEVLGPDQVTVILDVGHAGGTVYNFENRIHPAGKPLLVQGGTPLKPRFGLNAYASLPGAVGDTGYNRFPRAKQVSCNATWTTTTLALISQTLDIESVVLNLQRRFADTEDVGRTFNPKDHKMVHVGKYESDVASVLPTVKRKMTSYASKNDWRTCHYGTMLVWSPDSINVDDVKEAFAEYGRAIFLENDLAAGGVEAGMEKIIEAGKKHGIPDGDVLLPMYHVSLLDRNTLCVSGYNPQRSITLPSSIDWLWSVLGETSNWRGSFDKTNTEMMWHGNPLYGVKELLQEELNK